jgi:transposase
MRRVREILPLKHECGATDRAIARSLGIARSTVGSTLERVAAAGLRWPLPATLTDRVLEAMLYAGHGPRQGEQGRARLGHVHHERRRPGVTLMLLWEEYRQRQPGGYGYSRWCELYRAWEGRLSPTMRQAHPAGERMFVDYAGQSVDLIDRRSGEIRPAQIFVAAMGASSYTHAEATLTQSLPDWIGAHVRALAFMGGVPAQLVPDNPKVGVDRANWYEPAASADPRAARRAHHRANDRAVLQRRARRPPHPRRRPRTLHHDPRAHAERSPALCRVDHRAHPRRCGGDRGEHRQARGADPGESAASRAGLPCLHRHPASGPALRRRTPGSGL